MARRLVWMPVFPRVMVSEALNFRGSTGRAKARCAKAEAWREKAPAAEITRWRNSRRFMGPPCCGVPRAPLISHGRAKQDSVIRHKPRARGEELRSRGNARPRPIFHLWRRGIRRARHGP